MFAVPVLGLLAQRRDAGELYQKDILTRFQVFMFKFKLKK